MNSILYLYFKYFLPEVLVLACDLGQVVHTHCPAPLKLRLYGAMHEYLVF